MTKLSILLLSGVFLLSCNNNQSQTTEGTTDTTTQSGAVNQAETDACYKYISGKDSVLIHLTMAGDIVTGDLVYSFFEKDDNTGTIQGRIKGDTVFADYTFMSEGQESVREIALLKKGNMLVEGYGEMKEANNKMVFVDTSSLNFGGKTILTKVDCVEN